MNEFLSFAVMMVWCTCWITCLLMAPQNLQNMLRNFLSCREMKCQFKFFPNGKKNCKTICLVSNRKEFQLNVQESLWPNMWWNLDGESGVVFCNSIFSLRVRKIALVLEMAFQLFSDNAQYFVGLKGKINCCRHWKWWIISNAGQPWDALWVAGAVGGCLYSFACEQWVNAVYPRVHFAWP